MKEYFKCVVGNAWVAPKFSVMLGFLEWTILFVWTNLRKIAFRDLRGSLPKSGPLDFATKNTFALFFVGEEALVGVY